MEDWARQSGIPNNAQSKDDKIDRIVDADALVSRPDMTLADKVRWLVREMLPLGSCSLEEVAQHLGVDRRGGAPASCAQRRNVFVTHGSSVPQQRVKGSITRRIRPIRGPSRELPE